MKKIVMQILMVMCIVAFTGCSDTKDVSQEKDVNTAQSQGEQEEKQEEKKEAGEQKKETTEKGIQVKDAFGETISLKKNPKNVVCLYNSYLDLWDQAGGEVAGRIETKAYVPEKAKDATIVGTMSKPDMEKIISLKPELVIMSDNHMHSQLIDMFKENNIPYYAVSYKNLQEFLDVYKVFTTLTGHKELYKEKGLKLKEDIEAIIAKVPKDRKPKALILFGTSKIVKVMLPNSQVGSMVEDLGATNIAFDAQLSDEEMQTFSMERVVERAPDTIFVQTMGDVEKVKKRIGEDVETNPAWSSLDAVKNKQYFYLDKSLYLYKPNMRYAEAYEGLAKLLYPDVFGE